MELIDNFKEDTWTRGDPEKQTGFMHCRVMQVQPQKGEGEYIYAVFDDDGTLYKLNLNGGYGKRDPLYGVSNLDIRYNDEKQIVGVIIEDECVLRKSFAEEINGNAENGTDSSQST